MYIYIIHQPGKSWKSLKNRHKPSTKQQNVLYNSLVNATGRIFTQPQTPKRVKPKTQPQQFWVDQKFGRGFFFKAKGTTFSNIPGLYSSSLMQLAMTRPSTPSGILVTRRLNLDPEEWAVVWKNTTEGNKLRYLEVQDTGCNWLLT